MLKVVVQKALNLPNVERFSKSDPYAKISFQGTEHKTEHIDNTLDPEWKEKNNFTFELTRPLSNDDKLDVIVKDHETVGSHKTLGKVTVPLRDLVKSKKLDNSYDLVDGKGRPSLAKIFLQMEYESPDKEEKKGGGGAAGGGGGGASSGGGGGGGGGGEEGDEDEDEEGGGGMKRIRRRRSRRKLSDKPQDFQIRIKIMEARNLPGQNIHPVVRVTVSNQRRETKVRHSTTKPIYNEAFTFNFHTSEAELFDDMVSFEVFNSIKFRSDALLASFEMDVGSIFDMDDHAFVRKWILLSEPVETEGGKKSKDGGGGGAPAGYLKATAMVLGPGDKPPLLASAPPKDDEDDIEANVLMPFGVERQPAIFNLKIYRAEDVPQMDTGFGQSIKKFFSFSLFGSKDKDKDDEESSKTKLVDPYAVFSFSGKEVKTDTKYGKDTPLFNTVLRLPLQFPSMCERLKVQLWDWDRGSQDDIIATAFIFLSSISGHGDEGFLPQFGPCYVNFYGSPREFSVLPDENEDLNKGVGEGVAYRGRALVELETTLGEVIEEPVGVIQGEEIIRAEAYRTRDEYKLFACFYEAIMVSETDGPVEFEVSIGNYGNMMDESVAPSNTPPTNAVYDGCHYHYLPWFQEKPCVCVTSFWEDIAHRLEPLNVINRRFERLQMSFERVKKEVEVKEPAKKEKKSQSAEQLSGKEDRIFSMLCSLLDNFVNEFSKPLPDTKGRKNKLDNKIKSFREKELNSLVRDAHKQQAKLLLPETQSTKEETINNLMAEMEDYLQRLKDLAFEPQNSMPDVILWMICGSKRIAYYRIPAHDLLFSRNEDASGKLCGTTEEIRLKYPGKKAYDIKDHPEVPAMLRIEMWLGKTADQVHWTDRKGNGDFALYAETYQNQTRLIPMTDFKDSSMFRPNWSNANGTIEMKKENFQAPANWNMDVNNWKLSPELSLKFDSDAGHKTFLEEVYETQTRRIPGGAWPQDKIKWTDVHGDELTVKSLKEIQCPKGWQWKHPERDWIVDKNRAVDNDGWEYALDPSLAAYDPVQKAYHLSRRRRFVRKRKLVDKNAAKKRDHINEFEKEGWAYAPTFDGKFHAQTRNADFVRRRRYLNKLTPKGGAIKEFPPILRVKLKGKVKDEDAESQPNVWPRMFVTFQTPMKFQLWVYIYQARDLPALDESGMSDPYVRAAFGNQSLATKTHHKSLCPTWDRSLIFENVAIHESLANLEQNPPSVVLEVFDEDPVGKDDFLGRCMLKPVIKKDGFKLPQPGEPQEPRLLWRQLKKGEDKAGEVLASCELFWIKDETIELPHVPSKGKVRDGVRPIRQWSAIEVLCWGVRNMKKFQLTNVTSPSVEFECNGELMVSEPIKNTKKNPNFKQPTLERKIVKLPVDPMYLPPVNIRVRDNRTFGRKPIVGVYSVKSLANFRCQRPAQPDVITVEVDGGTPPTPPRSASTSTPESPTRTPTGRKPVTSAPESPITPDVKTVEKKSTAVSDEDEEFDWWSKFFASDFVQDQSDAGPAPAPEPETSGAPKVFQFLTSSGQEKKADHLELYRKGGYDTMQIYKQELETVEAYEGFQDFVSTFPIRRGKTKSNDEEEDTIVGELKGSFRIYPMPPKDSEGKFPETETVFSNVTSNKPRECIVRLYVVAASQLQPQDPSGLADPYLKVTLGKNKFDESDNYKPNTLTPSFGKMFEMKATIPLEKDLKVTVMDYDMLTRDDLIGETVIDLENRLLSKYRATCGLPHTFCRKFECSGPPHRWRDIKDPYVILKDWCAAHMSGVDVKLYGSGKPNSPYRMVLGDREYSLEQFEITPFQKSHLKGAKNRDNRKQQLALFVLDQLGLVPEHIETRPLYNPLQPGLEQGRIQLWVDIFPTDEGVPGMPVYIAPRQPSCYHLRVIIWNTTDVVLEETSVTGEKMSDIYLKGWMAGHDEKQRTDVHYRSLDGDGNFNWRMEFPFDYLPIEKMHVVKKKAHFWSKDVTEEQLPPVFNVQVWDNDLFSKDDFIGQRDLNLVALEKPCAKPSSCGGRNDPGKKGEKINLFKKGTINGWWALYPGEESAQKKKEKAKGKKTTDEDEEDGATKKKDPVPSYQFHPLDEDDEDDEPPAKTTVKKKKDPVPSGKVEMTLELIPELEAQVKLVGKGQDDPNQYPHLDKPNRPATSFLWFTSPFKTLKYIIWRNYKWYIIGALLILLLIAAIVLFLYNMPGYGVKKLFGV